MIMASTTQFESIPPFPQDVPLADIRTVSLANLRLGDKDAVETLMSSCRGLGFFMLDLHGDHIGGQMINETDQLFDFGKKLMSLPDEEKQRYLHDAPKSFLGFKPKGQAKIETNEPDRFEWFNIGQDGLMGNSPLQPLPPLAHSNLSLLKSFLIHGQDVVALISTVLASELGLPPDSFTRLQPPTKPSGTAMRFIKAFASPKPEDQRTSMIHHTDFGTITLLANVLGGLQILAPGKDANAGDSWLWVRPQAGCLIVNLGDAMVQWTGGVLRSNVHRINHAPGQQRFVDRYSLAILVRPERNASMKRLTGEGADSDLTAWEWEVKQMMALRHEENTVNSSSGTPFKN
ncbi:oxidoreductase [Astrocystis sublimbata]|nr:oxidoreductase [Astrocystis sublimbata]